MDRTLVEIFDDPVGAQEEILAGWVQSLEDCGMTVQREPRVVSRRHLNYTMMDEGEWE